MLRRFLSKLVDDTDTADLLQTYIRQQAVMNTILIDRVNFLTFIIENHPNIDINYYSDKYEEVCAELGTNAISRRIN